MFWIGDRYFRKQGKPDRPDLHRLLKEMDVPSGTRAAAVTEYSDVNEWFGVSILLESFDLSVATQPPPGRQDRWHCLIASRSFADLRSRFPHWQEYLWEEISELPSFLSLLPGAGSSTEHGEGLSQMRAGLAQFIRNAKGRSGALKDNWKGWLVHEIPERLDEDTTASTKYYFFSGPDQATVIRIYEKIIH
ncbi:MAG: hypothetical protein CMN76_16250 [Spirochaetaceae bacterium]|nr:hypothetical protein [Spirochaetaceae bacterium]|tara:strand:- start:16876 stop:17448 length:573 start_codon:yes stop_codon:yes gene_type:complete